MPIRRVVLHLRGDDAEADRGFYAGFLGFDVAMDLGWIVTFASPSNPTAQVNLYGEAAPPMPSSATSTSTLASVAVTRTRASEAWAYFATLVNASAIR